MRAATPLERDAELNTLIGALRDITEAQQQGGTWAQIGARLTPPMTGREAKKAAHRLRDEVTRVLRGRAAEVAGVREEIAGEVERAQDGEG